MKKFFVKFPKSSFLAFILGFLLPILFSLSERNFLDQHPLKMNASQYIPYNPSKININFASEKELTQLKGIGNSLAKKIIEYRNKNGSFENAEQLRKVKGLGSKKIALIESQISFVKSSICFVCS